MTIQFFFVFCFEWNTEEISGNPTGSKIISWEMKKSETRWNFYYRSIITEIEYLQQDKTFWWYFQLPVVRECYFSLEEDIRQNILNIFVE